MFCRWSGFHPYTSAAAATAALDSNDLGPRGRKIRRLNGHANAKGEIARLALNFAPRLSKNGRVEGEKTFLLSRRVFLPCFWLAPSDGKRIEAWDLT